MNAKDSKQKYQAQIMMVRDFEFGVG